MIASIKLLEEQTANLQRESDELRKRNDGFKDTLETTRRNVAVLSQQLSEMSKRVEEWDRRWWGLIALMIGAIFTLASGLIVSLLRR